MADDCDNGWTHLCGVQHDREIQVDPETDELVTGFAEGSGPVAVGGCQTVRCETHCSCFFPDGVHHEDCAKAGSDEP